MYYGYCHHLDLHVRTHSFPTRRSSDQPCGNDLIDTGGYKARATRHDQMGDTADVRLLRKSPDGFQRQGGGGIGIELHTYRCRWKRSEEHTSELQSLMRISYAVFYLKKKQNQHCK